MFLIISNFYLGKKLLKKFNINSSFESKLLNEKYDLVFFLDSTPSNNLFKKINTAVTVMDLCHRDLPEFPEVRIDYEYEYREHTLSNLNKNTLILVESPELKKNIANIYNIDEKKIFDLPNSFSANHDNTEFDDSEKSIKFEKLLPKEFFFYPAQYWPHKNHIVLINAVNILKKKGIKKNFVFCGNDMGNINFLKQKVLDLDLSENFTFLNFLKDDEIDHLYKNCEAVVMPTFFGPTNIPMFASWHYKKIFFYSSHLKNQFSNCAIFCDPFQPTSWAEAISKFDINSDYYQNILINSSKKLAEVQKHRIKKIEDLSFHLDRLRKILSTYS